jgi:tetratricopeptide (TPR) repeat protein
MSKGTQFLSDTNTQREAEQYLESLISSDKAIVALQEEGNTGKIAETYSARSITFIHLHNKTKDKMYLVLARSAASVAVDIARLDGDKSELAIPLLGLGRIHTKLEEHQKATKYYQEALENMSGLPPAVVADTKIHLAASQYKTGDESAIDRLKQALSELESADHDSYEKNVWVSGAYMKLAELLNSKDYLTKAKEIIDSDPRLAIRLKQWTVLSETLK